MAAADRRARRARAATRRPARRLRKPRGVRSARAGADRGAAHATAAPSHGVDRAPRGRSGASGRVSVVQHAAFLGGGGSLNCASRSRRWASLRPPRKPGRATALRARSAYFTAKQ
ncbi:hypothetical protein FBR04_16750 [Betaproteobacteria bacterium PRO7]|nr:hypothetical protein [Betaproteobacteria bacterium PRO7]